MKNKKYVVKFKTNQTLPKVEYWLVNALTAIDALGKAMIIANNPDEGKDRSQWVDAEVNELVKEI